MNRLFFIGLALVVAFFVFRWFTAGGTTEPVETVAQAIADGAQVVDVRTASEYESGHVVGATHADLLSGDLEEKVDGLDRDKPVYLYCASGHRSGRAASVLEGMGFTRVVNAGSISSLAAAGVPTEQ